MKKKYSFYFFIFWLNIATAESKFISSYLEKNQYAENFLTASYPQLTQIDGYKATHFHHGGEVIYKWQYPDEMMQDDYIGYKHSASTQVRHIQRMDHKLVYDAIYSFDEYSRRVTPVSKSKKTKKFIALLGCSLTYGNGLNDDQTLNYFLAKHSTDFYPYNYAIGASGINTMLAVVEKNDLASQIPEKSGVFIYNFIDEHIYRSLKIWPFSTWNGHTANYEYIEGSDSLKKVGSLKQEYPLHYWFINTIGRWFGQNLLKMRHFPSASNADYEKVCQMVKQIELTVKMKIPDSQLMIYSSLRPLPKAFAECLERKKIEIVQNIFTNNILYKPENKYFIDHDGHPNGHFNELIAIDILNYLSKNN